LSEQVAKAIANPVPVAAYETTENRQTTKHAAKEKP